MKEKTRYVVPQSEALDPLWAFVLCASPGNGESEDLVYEDWNSLVN